MSQLRALRDGWDEAAREDPMFYIVTDARYRGGGWPEEEFFEHGRREIEAMRAYLLDHGFLVGRPHGRALDFGCGVGRLTQALAEHYDRTVGCDISIEMVQLARRYNRHGVRCQYVKSGAMLLSSFQRASFDFIYSRIVLQHMPTDLQEGYVNEFVHLLSPRGLACFQIPEGPDYAHPQSFLSMYGAGREQVGEWIHNAGGKLLDVEHLEDASPQWAALRYTVTRS